ncbi:unnamed protein product [Ilex paraguariensis]|uniref:Uncharacterized protein n=1 Tax=Ilex paraguariensis TaxID=185542 RepID=A0ABC8QZQ1_9AQUA
MKHLLEIDSEGDENSRVQLEMLEGAKSMGAGVATIASRIANILSSSIYSVERHPLVAKQSFGTVILGFALTEAIASLAQR